MRLIFLGVPGAGKSTQAAAISSQWQIPHISIDDIFHQAIAKETYLGLKVKPYVEKGDLIPDDLILDIIRKRLSHSSAQRGWVLDGFPSNLSQVKLLDQLLLEILPQCRSVLPEKLYNQVFSFYVPIDVLVQRLLQRGRSVEVITQFLQDAVSKPRLITGQKTLNTRKKSIKEGKQILSA